MQITLIAALAKNRVIGQGGQLPWNLPEDLKHFKKATLGKTILMGYKTYLSLGKPLPQRRNLVLSTKPNLVLPGCEVFSSIEAAFAAVNPDEELMVIGGGHLFQELLPRANKMLLTLIEKDIPGDTFFPEWNPAKWREVSVQYFAADENNPLPFRIVEYSRR